MVGHILQNNHFARLRTCISLKETTYLILLMPLLNLVASRNSSKFHGAKNQLCVQKNRPDHFGCFVCMKRKGSSIAVHIKRVHILSRVRCLTETCGKNLWNLYCVAHKMWCGCNSFLPYCLLPLLWRRGYRPVRNVWLLKLCSQGWRVLKVRAFLARRRIHDMFV